MNVFPSGIDVAQRTFEVALWLEEQQCVRAEFANDPRGFRRLDTWLKRHGIAQLRVGLESTSTYAEALAEWLHRAGHAVYLLNPERTASYARSLGQRNKTDRADARTIGLFVARHQDLTPWAPPPPEQKTLRSLTRVRTQLSQQALLISNQLRTAEPAARRHLEVIHLALRQQLAAVGRDIAQQIKAHATLTEAVRHLMTIKCIGLVTAATLVAELPPITPQTDPRAISAWAGLIPRRRQTGRTEWRSFLSRKGNAYVRNALYMPSLVAKRFNPTLRAFASRLAANGKSNPAILGAIAHKLLRIAVGLLKSKTDFDPNWAFQKS